MSQKPPDASRCTGHCCRKIKIPPSPAELRHGEMDGRKLNEATVLAKILRPIGRDEDNERWVYRCILLTESGDCAAYRQRPTMCLDFPYGGRCTKDECTWEAARNGTARPPRHLSVWQPGSEVDGLNI